MAVLLMIDAPSPFAPTKELQTFLGQWEGSQEAAEDPLLTMSLQLTREELARRAGKNAS